MTKDQNFFGEYLIKRLKKLSENLGAKEENSRDFIRFPLLVENQEERVDLYTLRLGWEGWDNWDGSATQVLPPRPVMPMPDREEETWAEESTPPIRRKQVNYSTPLKNHIDKAQNAVSAIDPQEIEAHAFVTSIGHRLIYSSPVKNALPSASITPPGNHISKKFNFDRNINVESPVNLLGAVQEGCMLYNDMHSTLSSTSADSIICRLNMSDGTSMHVEQLKQGGVKALVHGLSSYLSIQRQIKKTMERCGLDDKDFVFAIREKIRNQTADGENFNKLDEKGKGLVGRLVTLLFVAEPTRDQSAIIMHQMFLDLVIRGSKTFDDLAKSLPLTMKGAVSVVRALSDEVYIDAITGHHRYDTSEKSHCEINDPKLQDYLARSRKLTSEWLGIDINQTIQSNLEVHANKINAACVEWYGVGLKQFKVTEDVLSEDLAVLLSPEEGANVEVASSPDMLGMNSPDSDGIWEPL